MGQEGFELVTFCDAGRVQTHERVTCHGVGRMCTGNL